MRLMWHQRIRKFPLRSEIQFNLNQIEKTGIRMTAKLFITSTCHIKQVLNACMVYLSNQPSFQSYRHCWPIRTDFKACTNLPRSHCLFLFQSKTSHFESFRCLRAKVVNASHTPKVVWWAGITKQFIVSPLQDLPIQDLLKHLMRHILRFFSSRDLTGLTFPLTFLASVSSNYPELNRRQESTPEWNVTGWQHQN